MTRSDDWLTDDRLQDLLAEWVERREAGEEVAAKALCEGQPELVEPLESAIEELKQTDWIVNSTDASQNDDPSSASQEYWWIELAEMVTAEQLLERIESASLRSKQELGPRRTAIGCQRKLNGSSRLARGAPVNITLGPRIITTNSPGAF